MATDTEPNHEQFATPNAEPNSSQWRTVAQVAQILGISERAIQKRCAAGTVRARRVDTPKGAVWQIDAASIETRPGRAVRRPEPKVESSPNRTVRNDEPRSSPQTEVIPAPVSQRSEQFTNDLMSALLSEKDGRIADLQKQLDAANLVLEREQLAHSETRRVLAFNMATPAIAPTDTPTPSAEAVKIAAIAPEPTPTVGQARRAARQIFRAFLGLK
jgi:hypothetical protein